MVADPNLAPATVGIMFDEVCPAAIVKLVGLTVTLEVSLLPSVTTTPPAGAGACKVTGNGPD